MFCFDNGNWHTLILFPSGRCHNFLITNGSQGAMFFKYLGYFKSHIPTLLDVTCCKLWQPCFSLELGIEVVAGRLSHDGHVDINLIENEFVSQAKRCYCEETPIWPQ